MAGARFRQWWSGGEAPWTVLALALLAAALVEGTIGGSLRSFRAQPYLFLVFFVAAIISVTIHEYAHARAAKRLGDHSIAPQRLTLNPLAQIDLLGAAVILASATGLGYGRPLLVDEAKVSAAGRVMVALAGPLANFALAAGASVPLQMHVPNTPLFPYSDFFRELLGFNCVYALFNLLPIPPLDGAGIVQALLAPPLAAAWKRLRFVGPFVIALLVVRGQPLIEQIVTEPARAIIRMMLTPMVAP